MRALLASSFVLVTSFVTVSASANGGGLAGYTGKPNAGAPQGESCNSCHSGGTAPQVSITGPATLTAGQVAQYSLVVKTGQTRAAGGIAATDGVVLAPVTGLRESFGEMVQNSALTPSGGQATFTFKVTAPSSGTGIKLWAVGLAANGSGKTGDKATHTTKDIAVTGGTTAPPPDAGSAAADSGTAPVGPTSPGGATDAGSTAPVKTGASSGSDPGASDEEEDEDAAAERRSSAAPEAGACSSRGRATTSGLLPVLVIGGLAAAFRRRRRRRA